MSQPSLTIEERGIYANCKVKKLERFVCCRKRYSLSVKLTFALVWFPGAIDSQTEKKTNEWCSKDTLEEQT